MKVEFPLMTDKPKKPFFAPIFSLIKFRFRSTKAKSHCRGSAMVEIAISLPVALTVVLGSVHLSVVMREANIIVEAARHGARSAAAQSGINTPAPNTAPNWSLAPNTYDVTCARDTATPPQLLFMAAPRAPNDPFYGLQIAAMATCDYLVASDDSMQLDGANWKVEAAVIADLNFGGLRTYPAVSITLKAINNPRGPVDSLKAFFNVLPRATSIYPLLRTT